MVEAIVNMFSFLLDNLNYFTIFLLMAVESSFFPLPSEIIMIPAGVLASQGHLSFLGVVIAGVAGSIVGALFNYAIALHLGRRLVDKLVSKYGKFLLVSDKSLSKTEKYFESHGSITTFIGRLIPVVRHLISLPAGFARMPLASFILYTALGAAVWCLILTAFGYVVGENWDVINQYLNTTSIIVIIAGIIIVFLYWHFKKK